ncbi:Heterokaryon incompatibility protein (HET) domain containing protein [Rhypophila sp. PSN 637]
MGSLEVVEVHHRQVPLSIPVLQDLFTSANQKMRLINVHNLRFHEFFGSQLNSVQYAILSHTWGDEEVSYLEMRDANDRIRSRSGYAKIFNAAKQAQQDDLDWVWVDTCCIDKSSSAELTEAINSMFKWYERSAVCYAYLEDIEAQPTVQQDSTQLTESKWFTRGWTLQELVAPNAVIFYSRSWYRIGEKLGVSSKMSHITSTEVWDRPGKELLSRASGIPYELLFEGRTKESYSVAQRMSWASRRVCTRVEDTAYCLMGLFDINMPLLYGEEEQAFTRLQEEIIRTTDDHSIYAWKLPEGDELSWSFCPVLATSPRLFAGCAHMVVSGRERGQLSTITKHGLRIQTRLRESCFPIRRHVVQCANSRCYQMVLNCYETTFPGIVEPSYSRIVLWLIDVDSSGTGNGSGEPRHFYRIATTVHENTIIQTWNLAGKMKDPRREDEPSISRNIYITQRLPWNDVMMARSDCVFQFGALPSNLETPGQARRISYKPGTANNELVIERADQYTTGKWSHMFNGMASEPLEDFDWARKQSTSFYYPLSFHLTRAHALILRLRKPASQKDPAPSLSSCLLVFRAMMPNEGNNAEPRFLARVSEPCTVTERGQFNLMAHDQIETITSGINGNAYGETSSLVRYETDRIISLPKVMIPDENTGGVPRIVNITVDCKEIDPPQGKRRFCFRFDITVSPGSEENGEQNGVKALFGNW